jgi:hypothetical protein
MSRINLVYYYTAREIVCHRPSEFLCLALIPVLADKLCRPDYRIHGRP